MSLKKFCCITFACLLVVGAISRPVYAAEAEKPATETIMGNAFVPRATGSLNMTIPPKTKLAANTSFQLAAGETVTIKASCAPFSADVDFGLIAPNGVFYYFKITDGNINKTMRVSESGYYTLQVRNNSSFAVDVVGLVNY